MQWLISNLFSAIKCISYKIQCAILISQEQKLGIILINSMDIYKPDLSKTLCWTTQHYGLLMTYLGSNVRCNAFDGDFMTYLHKNTRLRLKGDLFQVN